MVKELVSLGVGLRFLSKRAIKSDLDIGKYKAFYIKGLKFTRKFYFAYHKNRQLSPLNEKFRDFMLNLQKTKKFNFPGLIILLYYFYRRILQLEPYRLVQAF